MLHLMLYIIVQRNQFATFGLKTEILGFVLQKCPNFKYNEVTIQMLLNDIIFPKAENMQYMYLTSSIPDYSENKEPPIICYKYNNPIRSTIFNFNKLVANLDIDTKTPDS